MVDRRTGRQQKHGYIISSPFDPVSSGELMNLLLLMILGHFEFSCHILKFTCLSYR